MRQRKAILHIGTAKTGSTTIQRLLAQSRKQLLRQGFAYPTSPGAKNHFRLVIAGADTAAANAMARVIGEAGDAAAVAQRFKRELAAELEAMPDSVHTVIFSNEHCYAKIDSAEAAARLRDFLAPFFDEFRILVYLRRQDELAVSRYTTRLRAGGTETQILPHAGSVLDDDDEDEDDEEDSGEAREISRLSGRAPPATYDWAGMLDRWTAAFGKDAICPRVFARDAFVGGDLMLDVQAACGLEGVFEPGARAQNSSLVPAAQEFLRQFNAARRAAVTGGGKPPKMPAAVKRVMAQEFSGPGRRPARADAEAYYAAFAESNERLRAGYFPDRDLVFSADFSKYPAQEDPLPSGAEVLKVALAVLVRGLEDAPLRAADENVRRGRLLLESGDAAKAAHSFRRALSAMPGHAEARAALSAMGESDTPGAAPAGEPEEKEAAKRRRQERQEKRRAERPGAAGKLPDAAAGPAREPSADGKKRLDLTPEERALRRARRAEREKRQGDKTAAA